MQSTPSQTSYLPLGMNSTYHFPNGSNPMINFNLNGSDMSSNITPESTSWSSKSDNFPGFDTAGPLPHGDDFWNSYTGPSFHDEYVLPSLGPSPVGDSSGASTPYDRIQPSEIQTPSRSKSNRGNIGAVAPKAFQAVMPQRNGPSEVGLTRPTVLTTSSQAIPLPPDLGDAVTKLVDQGRMVKADIHSRFIRRLLKKIKRYQYQLANSEGQIKQLDEINRRYEESRQLKRCHKCRGDPKPAAAQTHCYKLMCEECLDLSFSLTVEDLRESGQMANSECPWCRKYGMVFKI